MKFKFAFLCSLFALLIFSCVSGITMNAIQKINRGMTHEEFMSQIKSKPKLTFPFNDQETQYTIDIYSMQTGTRTQSTYIWNKYGGYTTTTEVPVYDDYYFVFNESGLVFWGFMNELQKSDDVVILNLAPKISAEAKIQYNKKAKQITSK